MTNPSLRIWPPELPWKNPYLPHALMYVFWNRARNALICHISRQALQSSSSCSVSIYVTSAHISIITSNKKTLLVWLVCLYLFVLKHLSIAKHNSSLKLCKCTTNLPWMYALPEVWIGMKSASKVPMLENMAPHVAPKSTMRVVPLYRVLSHCHSHPWSSSYARHSLDWVEVVPTPPSHPHPHQHPQAHPHPHL